MAAAAPLKGKNTARTAWRLAAVSCLLLVFFAVLLISTTTTTTVPSRQGLTSGQRGSEFRGWRKDVLRPDRTTDMSPPPSPKANNNVPGGPPVLN